MSFEALLNHTCDIYHIVEGDRSPGYNLPASPSFSYPEEPDISAQPCHFCVRSANVSITQTEPINIEDARKKLLLPIGTDVRLNDKIINRGTGEEYKAERPVDVRDHHTFVYIKKIEEERHL